VSFSFHLGHHYLSDFNGRHAMLGKAHPLMLFLEFWLLSEASEPRRRGIVGGSASGGAGAVSHTRILLYLAVFSGTYIDTIIDVLRRVFHPTPARQGATVRRSH
jgi:hypothetical protein